GDALELLERIDVGLGGVVGVGGGALVLLAAAGGGQREGGAENDEGEALHDVFPRWIGAVGRSAATSCLSPEMTRPPSSGCMRHAKNRPRGGFPPPGGFDPRASIQRSRAGSPSASSASSSSSSASSASSSSAR